MVQSIIGQSDLRTQIRKFLNKWCNFNFKENNFYSIFTNNASQSQWTFLP